MKVHGHTTHTYAFMHMHMHIYVHTHIHTRIYIIILMHPCESIVTLTLLVLGDISVNIVIVINLLNQFS